MPIAEDKALEILAELIRKPESNPELIPHTWSEILGIHAQHFSPVAEVPKKRRRNGASNPNIGWPAGVKRAEYMDWKEQQLAQGITEQVNPQEYKRQRDSGTILAAPMGSIKDLQAAAKNKISKATAARREKRTLSPV